MRAICSCCLWLLLKTEHLLFDPALFGTKKWWSRKTDRRDATKRTIPLPTKGTIQVENNIWFQFTSTSNETWWQTSTGLSLSPSEVTDKVEFCGLIVLLKAIVRPIIKLPLILSAFFRVPLPFYLHTTIACCSANRSGQEPWLMFAQGSTQQGAFGASLCPLPKQKK